jgi:hypothetical protein
MINSQNPSTAPARDETAEATALQSWLVANARHHRPMTSTGLMAWALAALQAQDLSETRK